MLEAVMICIICFFALSMAWFTPQAGTPEMDKPLGKQFACIALVSLPLGLGFANLVGVI